jgi:hypothetical protein
MASGQDIDLYSVRVLITGGETSGLGLPVAAIMRAHRMTVANIRF